MEGMNMNMYEYVNLKILDVYNCNLTYDRLNHTFYGYVIVGYIYNFDSWRNRYKKLVLIDKNKMISCKTFLIVIKMLEDLIRKSPFHCFSFSDISYTFAYCFNQKLFMCIHLSLFIDTIQNSTILSSSNTNYWKSVIFFVKVQSALYWWNTRPLTLDEFKNYYKLY